jgi:hypothetical protein
MTNTENVYAVRDVNKAYAYLMGMALRIDNKRLYEKLEKERSWCCESLERYYQNNKTSGLKTK